jgi:hypothetical protein
MRETPTSFVPSPPPLCTLPRPSPQVVGPDGVEYRLHGLLLAYHSELLGPTQADPSQGLRALEDRGLWGRRKADCGSRVAAPENGKGV